MRVKIPSKCLENKQVIIFAKGKEVATTAGAQAATTTLVTVPNLATSTSETATLANRSFGVK